jgi:magnesium transporter
VNLQQIDKYIIEDIENPNHPSEFISQEGYSVLIVRLPSVAKEEVVITSFAFVVKGNEVYTFNREAKEFDKLGDFDQMMQFLDKKVEKLLKDVQRYHFEIELLEDSLFDEHISDMFMQKWLSFKKDVSLIHRVMFHTALAFELFVSYYKKEETFEFLAFGDLLEHMGRIRDLSQSAKEKLDNLYDFYRAKVDEKMNKNMYYLTIISGIFLPLTLITGFFGMNTGGLPLMEDPNGTTKVIIISVILEVLFMAPFILMNTKRIQRFKRKKS